jgi:hypothetical protein
VSETEDLKAQSEALSERMRVRVAKNSERLSKGVEVYGRISEELVIGQKTIRR